MQVVVDDEEPQLVEIDMDHGQIGRLGFISLPR
jgi:hypothetical protein